jgi:hypothetical protein
MVAIVAVLIAGVVVLRPHDSDNRLIVLPATLAGLRPSEPGLQFAQSGDWRTQLEKKFGDHPFDGRAYGAARPGPLVNLVVVRKDARHEGDPALGRPPYTQIGDVSCTRTFQLPDSSDSSDELSKPWRSNSMMVCWRAGETLTVSVMVQLSPAGYEQTAATAVDDVWALDD